MFLRVGLWAVAVLSVMGMQAARAEGNQVFYRYGMSNLNNDRGGEIFTDTGGGKGKNDDTKGFNLGAGIDLMMLKDIGPGNLLGEVMVDYARYSRKQVHQTTSFLNGAGTNTSKVAVSGLSVVIAPKYRMSFLDGALRPWIIPIGVAYLVNSPPSNDSTYLDIGYHAGVGVEYAVISMLSVGLDYRMTIASKESGVDMSNSSTDLYVGVNF